MFDVLASFSLPFGKRSVTSLSINNTMHSISPKSLFAKLVRLSSSVISALLEVAATSEHLPLRRDWCGICLEVSLSWCSKPRLLSWDPPSLSNACKMLTILYYARFETPLYERIMPTRCGVWKDTTGTAEPPVYSVSCRKIDGSCCQKHASRDSASSFITIQWVWPRSRRVLYL